MKSIHRRPFRSALSVSVLLAAAAASVAGCAAPTDVEATGASAAAIYGGGAVPDPDSGVVKIVTSVASCTGRMLTNEWAVTARHCFQSGGKALKKPETGTVVSTPTQSQPADLVVLSPRLDVALVRVAKEIKTTFGVPLAQPYPFRFDPTTPFVPHPLAKGAVVTCQGYGGSPFVPREAAFLVNDHDREADTTPDEVPIAGAEHDVVLLDAMPAPGTSIPTAYAVTGDSGTMCTVPFGPTIWGAGVAESVLGWTMKAIAPWEIATWATQQIAAHPHLPASIPVWGGAPPPHRFPLPLWP